MSRLEATLNLEVIEKGKFARLVDNKNGLLLSEENADELRKIVHTVVDQVFDKFVNEFDPKKVKFTDHINNICL